MRYAVNYPRDFANEYTIAAFAATSDIPRGWERISRQEAIRLGLTRPHEADISGEQWYGGWANPRSGIGVLPGGSLGRRVRVALGI